MQFIFLKNKQAEFRIACNSKDRLISSVNPIYERILRLFASGGIGVVDQENQNPLPSSMGVNISSDGLDT